MPPTIIGVVGGYFARNAAIAAARAAGSTLPPRPPPRPPAPGGGGRNPATVPVPPCPGTWFGRLASCSKAPPPSVSGECSIAPTSLPVFVSYLRTVFCPRYAKPLLSTSMPCPCGAANDPIRLPSLSKWSIDGGSVQQSAIGGLSSASSSMLVRSFGRSYAQMVSSFGATARPVMPPIFHLFGRGLGQPGSYR